MKTSSKEKRPHRKSMVGAFRIFLQEMEHPRNLIHIFSYFNNYWVQSHFVIEFYQKSNLSQILNNSIILYTFRNFKISVRATNYGIRILLLLKNAIVVNS